MIPLAVSAKSLTQSGLSRKLKIFGLLNPEVQVQLGLWAKMISRGLGFFLSPFSLSLKCLSVPWNSPAPCGGRKPSQVYFPKVKQPQEKNSLFHNSFRKKKNPSVDLYWADLSPSLNQRRWPGRWNTLADLGMCPHQQHMDRVWGRGSSPK